MSSSIKKFTEALPRPYEKKIPQQAVKSWLRHNNEAIWGVMLALPALVGFFFLAVGPMLASLFLGFTDWAVGGAPNWIGFANYREILFDDKLFWKSLQVTFYYVFGSVPLRIIVSLLVAVLLNQKVPAIPIFRTIFYIPTILPVIAVSVIWLWMFNPDFGLINGILRPLGFDKIRWIFGEATVIPSYILMSIWDIGGLMVIFLAGLQGIPRELHEAVEIDGGNTFHRFFYITLPLLTPTIFFNLVMTMVGAFQTFAQAMILRPDGGPNNASMFYALRLYRVAFRQNMEMGYASALAWIMFIIVVIISVIIFKTSSSWVYYEETGR